MLNKKIASELAVGMILLLAVAVGAIFWVENKNEVTDFTNFQEPKNILKSGIENIPAVKIIYTMQHHGTSSGYERVRSGALDDVYSEIYSIDPETKEQLLLFSDKDKSFSIESGYSNPKFIGLNSILVRLKDRTTNYSEYKILDINSLIISELPELPLPDGFVLNPLMINMLSDGGFVYVAGSEFESAIFVCNNDLAGMRKIFSTLDHDSVAINSIAVSRDNTKIAFSIGADGVGQGYVEENVYVMRSNGDNLKKVFDQKFTIGNVVEWLPDNEHFIFINSMFNDSSGKLSIVSMDGKMESLENQGMNLKISPDGTKILSDIYSSENDSAEYSLIMSNIKGEKIDDIVIKRSSDGVKVNSIGWITQ